MGVLINSYRYATGGGGGGSPLWEDDFNRADEAFSDADVTNLASPRVVSNRLSTTATFVEVGILIDGPTYTDHQWVRGTINVGAGGQIGGYGSFLQLNSTALEYSAVRVAANGYSLRVDTSGGSLGEVYKGETSIGVIAGLSGLVAGDVVEFRRTDNGGGSCDLEAWRNGSLAGAITDGSANLTGGFPGIVWFQGDTTGDPGLTSWDDVSAGDDTWTWP